MGSSGGAAAEVGRGGALMAKAKPHLRRARQKLERDGPDFLKTVTVLLVQQQGPHVLALWQAPTSKQYYVLHHWVLKRRRGQPGLAWRLTNITTYQTFLEGSVAFYCREAEVLRA